MSNPYFRFKQFTVYHDRCAMKVGTDGVLLGAWASVEKATTALDVGTGSGLIALMLAQRNSRASVTAIDIDVKALAQAEENIKASPFSERIAVTHSAFQPFAIGCSASYDLIVSNPPFFTRSLLPPDAGRVHARHSVSLSLDELLQGSLRCLSPDGCLALILPAGRLGELVQRSATAGFTLRRLTYVFPVPGAPARRVLAELSLMQGPPVEETGLVIEEPGHRYSDAFTDLVRDFYLYL